MAFASATASTASTLRQYAGDRPIGDCAAVISRPLRIASTLSASRWIAVFSASLTVPSLRMARRRFCSIRMSSNGRDGAASRISPAICGSRAPIRGAIIPPWLWPSTNTRFASMSGSPRSRAAAATASSVVSRSMLPPSAN